MSDRQAALADVLEGIAYDPQGQFAKEVFLEVLKRIQPVPNLPGEAVFLELMSKCVPCGLDLALVHKGKVLLTYRDDRFWTGRHFPGSYRAPRVDLTQDCQRAASKELGDIRITKATILRLWDQPENHRFHAVGMLVLCEFEGDQIVGQWFYKMPQDLIALHYPLWEAIRPYLYRNWFHNQWKFFRVYLRVLIR